jgi:hypothetical protein
MTYYTIAEVKNECFGHGDFSNTATIVGEGGYYNGFPPLFLSEFDALSYVEANKREYCYKYKIVKLKVWDE